MSPTLQFNKCTSLKKIVMDRHKSKGNKIVSLSKIFICASSLYKTAPFRNMHNNFASDHQ